MGKYYYFVVQKNKKINKKNINIDKLKNYNNFC
jgi:hypothetical protein